MPRLALDPETVVVLCCRFIARASPRAESPSDAAAGRDAGACTEAWVGGSRHGVREVESDWGPLVGPPVAGERDRNRGAASGGWPPLRRRPPSRACDRGGRG